MIALTPAARAASASRIVELAAVGADLQQGQAEGGGLRGGRVQRETLAARHEALGGLERGEDLRRGVGGHGHGFLQVIRTNGGPAPMTQTMMHGTPATGVTGVRARTYASSGRDLTQAGTSLSSGEPVSARSTRTGRPAPWYAAAEARGAWPVAVAART